MEASVAISWSRGWGQVRETATEDLHIFSESFGTFLGERKSVLSTFVVLFHVHIQFLIKPVRRKYSEI